MAKLRYLLLAIATLRLLRVRLYLQLLGLDRTLRWLQLSGGAATQAVTLTALQPAQSNPAKSDPWRERGLYLRRAARMVPGSYCLARALCLTHWARSYNVDARCVIGVRVQKTGSASTAPDAHTTTGASTLSSEFAHAWCELDREVIDDTPEVIAQFIPLWRSAGMPV